MGSISVSGEEPQDDYNSVVESGPLPKSGSG